LGILPRLVRSSINVVVLFSALVITPMLALSHFSAGMAAMLADFAEGYLPNPTLLSAEKKSRARAESQLREQRSLAARDRAAKRRAAAAGSSIVSNKGKRVLVRGTGAMMVGWIPVIGVAADVVSLSEDYNDICALFATIDEMSAMLYFPESGLYQGNYCDVPEQGIELLKETAHNTEFPWDPAQ
jgi:hypothetical protein